MFRTPRLALAILTLVASASAQTPPDKFFGFQLGADRKMARWDKIVDYFKLLEKESGGRMLVTNAGPSTMGNPFLIVYFSSPANLKNLEHLRQVNAGLSDPRGINEQQARQLAAQGKAVICQSMGLHATEIGGTQ